MKVSGEIRSSIYESVLYRRSDGKCGLIFAQDSGGAKQTFVPTRARKSASGAEVESRKSVYATWRNHREKVERRKGVIAKKCERRKGVIAKSASGAEAALRKFVYGVEPSSRKFSSEGGSVIAKECEGRANGILKK